MVNFHPRHRHGVPVLLVLVALLAACGTAQPPQQAMAPPEATTQALASPVPVPTATPLPPSSTPAAEPPTATPEDTPTPVPGYVPVFEPYECHILVPAAYQRRCGYLVVPEDRTQPEGPSVRLPVVIFESRSPNPAPDPVIHLVGGPGGDLLATSNYYLQAGGDRVLDTRDYVLFNQRGTHGTTPSLECPGQEAFSLELGQQPLTEQERDARETEFLLACQADLLSQGINLSTYNSASNAADVNDLRLALGYDQVNLYGISYGTRLALAVMRYHPGGIRSVILDSVFPPQVNLDVDVAPNAHRAFQALFGACAADSRCNALYPDLETVFFQVVDGLNASPATVQVRNGTVTAWLDGDRFMEAIFGSLYRADAIPWIPAMIYEASRGSYDSLRYPVEAILDTSHISWGMHYSVQCHEEVTFESAEAVRTKAADLPPQVAAHFATPSIFTLCAGWQAGQADPVENEPVTSDIPTLVLSGHYDPITPPDWGRLAAETLSHSYFYEFPTVGHGAIRSNACALEIGLQFLADPTTEPDASCLDPAATPEFR